MSLLMEALKKAERAKQEQANDPARASTPGGVEPFEERGQPKAQQPAEPADAEPSLQAASAPESGSQSEWPQISMPEPELALSFEPAPLPSIAPVRAEPVPPPVAYDSTRPLVLCDPEGSVGSGRSGSESFRELTLSTMPPAPEEPPAPVKAVETAYVTAQPLVPGDPKTSVGSVGRALGSAAQTDASKPKPAPPAATPQDAALEDRKIAAARQKAKSVFGAKQAPRSRALLLAGATLAVVAGCAVFGWYYWQLTYDSTRPSARSGSESFRVSGSSAVMTPGLVQQVPQAPQPEVVASVPPAQAAEPVAANTPAPQGDSDPLRANPTLPSGSHRTRARAESYAPQGDSDPLRAKARAESYAGAKSPPPANTPAPKDDTAIRIRQSTATNQVNPLLGKAYQSFIAGDIETSQQQYHKMLQQEPNNRDALLGMAAIALSRKQAGQSAAYYGKLLELDPADPDALAGLISLQGQTDPVQSESRLKKILAQNPQANAVHFALGNLYSQQSRWAEAQQAFFRAYSSAPGNADYAYNLAVSLDHLNQGKPALDYYQRALALGQSGPANFDKPSVHNRVKELQPAASN